MRKFDLQSRTLSSLQLLGLVAQEVPLGRLVESVRLVAAVPAAAALPPAAALRASQPPGPALSLCQRTLLQPWVAGPSS